MSYFMGKEGFVWWQGVVEDRHDPLYLGRCKVRVLGWHTEDKTDMPTESLPWAYPISPITSASQTGVGTSPLGPVEGTWVIGFFRDGESAQEPMFFGTIGGIPELDAKGVNSDGTGIGGKGFFDPRLHAGDGSETIGHPDFPDEIGARSLGYNSYSKSGGHLVPREPATIIHNASPSPSDLPQEVKISDKVTLKPGSKSIDHPAHIKGEYSSFPVSSLISSASSETSPFSVQLVENPSRSTFPDTGLTPLDRDDPESLISATRNLNYLQEPTTNRLARGMRGNDHLTSPLLNGIVYEKFLNRLQGQHNISCADGHTWSEPFSPWAAIYPYNHVHQTESGHVIEMDDTPGHERLHWYHRTGTFTEMHPSGIKVDKIVNDYYNIVLGSQFAHIEGTDCITIDGQQQVFVKGGKIDRIDGPYNINMSGKGNFSLSNPEGDNTISGGGIYIETPGKYRCHSTNFHNHNKYSYSRTDGKYINSVGGKLITRAGSYSLNIQGSGSIQTGSGLSFNVTDSIHETIFGVLPAITLGYAKKTTATLGKIGVESTDNVLSGGIEMNLGLNGLGASISILPIGDIDFTSNLGLNGITGTALLGDINFSSVIGSVSLSSLLSSFSLTNTGAAQMQGLLGEVSIATSGKVKVKGLIASLKEVLDELIDIITEHTHPTGTGPSGPPLPPASIKLALLKSLKIGMSFD